MTTQEHTQYHCLISSLRPLLVVKSAILPLTLHHYQNKQKKVTISQKKKHKNCSSQLKHNIHIH